MFDSFTDRARKTMGEGRLAALKMGHDFIDTEHILLGLLATEGCVGIAMLETLRVDTSKLEERVKALVSPTGACPDSRSQLPFVSDAKSALEYALQEASGMGHNYIGTEHLLLGMLRAEDGIAYKALNAMGINATDVRTEVIELVGFGPDTDSD